MQLDDRHLVDNQTKELQNNSLITHSDRLIIDDNDGQALSSNHQACVMRWTRFGNNSRLSASLRPPSLQPTLFLASSRLSRTTSLQQQIVESLQIIEIHTRLKTRRRR